jgi:hypothetical protein
MRRALRADRVQRGTAPDRWLCLLSLRADIGDIYQSESADLPAGIGAHPATIVRMSGLFRKRQWPNLKTAVAYFGVNGPFWF